MRNSRNQVEAKNDPPNCPPTSVLLVLDLKFYTKILVIIYLTIPTS